MIERGLLIGGKEVDAADGAVLDVINPANGEVVGRIGSAGEADIDSAVAAARDAFEAGVWSDMPIWDRAKTLNRFSDAKHIRIHGVREAWRHHAHHFE